MKRKFVSILFALVLLAGLSLIPAVPAAAEPDFATLNVVPFTLDAIADDTAVWSDVQKNTGSYSVLLTHTADADKRAYVQFTPPTGITLDEFVAVPDTYGFSYWRTEDKIGPQLELTFTDGNDGWVELTAEVALYDYLTDDLTDQWIDKVLSGTEQCQFFGEDSENAGFSSTGLGDLSDLITDIATVAAADDAAAVGAWEMTKVIVDLGWSGDTQTAYIDDVIIDGVTYYGLIQDAIDAASTDDIILVADGTYEESISVTTDNLTLRSENGRDSTIIENVGGTTFPEVSQSGFLIRGPANNFTLGGAADQGFTFVGGTAPRLIQLNNGPSDVTISYNTINTTGTASTGINIGAAGATGLTVSNNTFIADAGSITLVGPCLVDVTVTYNNFSGPWDPVEHPGDIYTPAIYFSGVTASSSDSPSTISNNTITAHGRGILLENGDGTSNLLISGNNISNSYVGIKFDAGCMQGVAADITTVNVTQNTLSTNTVGLLIVDGIHIDASAFTITYNNFNGNTTYGLENAHTTEFVTAENNWWNNASGPVPDTLPETGYNSYGDKVDDYGVAGGDVDYEPWLLAEVVPEVTPTTFDKTLALKKDWTLVSTDKEVTIGSNWTGTIAYEYTPSSGYTEVSATDLEPVSAVYVKTVGGGGVGINYAPGAPGVSSKNLGAGWNLIGSATVSLDAYEILSPLRWVQVGEQQGVGLTTLVGQGNYNQYSASLYYVTLVDTEWSALDAADKTLYPFDGYWVYMNAAKSFGVIPY